ncbi:hypothetical protein BC834DRAFT_859369 [Gloeopeniophorella convolvens]|nr:hypothetical protein BC834DRAFT_859369 [Gloeopeniophorella convolvens]
MFIQLRRNLAITLFFSLALALTLAGPSHANGISSPAHRRDHVSLKRMIKMRAPPAGDPPAAGQGSSNQPTDGLGTVGAGANPPPPGSPDNGTGSSSSSGTSTSESSTSSTSSTSTTSSSTTSSTSSTSSSTSSTTSSTTSSSSSSTSTSSTSSTPTSSSTTSSTSSTPPPTSDTPPPTQPPATPTPPATPVNTPASVDSVTLTSHIAAASTTPNSDNDASQSGSSSLSHTTLKVIIVLASVVGGSALIWTIIRKWKFRPSAQFEDRLEPINWQPTDHESGLPTHRRVPSNASSFHSSGHDHGALSRSNSQGGAPSDIHRSLTPLPEHDFTAGAPVGGYADLARGPSPQPPMQEALQRGPSITRGYDNYGVPLHHQGFAPQAPQDAYDYNQNGARY